MRKKKEKVLFIGSSEKPDIPSKKMMCYNCKGDVWISDIEQMEEMKAEALCNICYFGGELSKAGSKTVTLPHTRERVKKELGVSDKEIDKLIQDMRYARNYGLIKKEIDKKLGGVK